MVKNIKEESKKNSTFDLNKMNKKDRELMTSTHDYVYKERVELKDLAHPKEDKVVNNKSNDMLVINSKETINKSMTAKQILEGVIEKIENNNQRLVDLVEKRQLNGFVLKAYSNAFKEAKKIDVEKKIKRKKVNKDDLYDYVFFKNKKFDKDPLKNKNYHPFLAEQGLD
jgi:hypothetical protein